MTHPTSPTVSVVMPVYNVERFVVQAVRSVLDQTFTDFELIIVDDGSPDGSIALCEAIADRRIRIIHQANRGLAGARNPGIAFARGEFVALLDSDDAWAPEKLARHVAHLRANPAVGAVYAGSILIDDDGQLLPVRQRPLLGLASARNVFCGQTILNGSAPVFRRAALEDAALPADSEGRVRYFDETLRRSEDVECWTRIALQTNWGFEGIQGDLTYYRISAAGLSADVIRQLASWEVVYDKVAAYAPEFIALHGGEARARELRYLARRSFHMRERGLALHLAMEALRTWPRLLWREPRKTTQTIGACAVLRLLPEQFFNTIARALGAPVAP